MGASTLQPAYIKKNILNIPMNCNIFIVYLYDKVTCEQVKTKLKIYGKY